MGAELITSMPDNLPVVAQWQQSDCQHLTSDNICPDCGSLFRKKCLLMEHIRRQHGRKRFACPICEFTFVSRGGLKEHVKYIHEKITRYRCETCGKGYANRTNYFDHVASHTGAKRNVCPVCKKQFAFKHGLKTHVLHFHPNEVEHL